MSVVNVLSGGAAAAVVKGVQAQFERESGAAIEERQREQPVTQAGELGAPRQPIWPWLFLTFSLLVAALVAFMILRAR